ncbi:hypothetical protein MHK_007083 [Candidatus Magnetomorum sp. HK-1]|nr:hypothetical protein MHK_007083 [Candidatus Magnetomorum sp. HK-1]
MQTSAQAGINKAVLILGADIKPELKAKTESNYNIQIIELNDLLYLSSKDLELLGKLVKLCEINLGERNFDENIQKLINPKPLDPTLTKISSREVVDKGNGFIKKLQSIPFGKEGRYIYEDTCSEILEYLFGYDLKGWHKQERTTDDLHRYDLICRVLDNTRIWKFISTNLDSRYVLFEFKNYKDKIGQSQVYSTEKYLYEKAKRRVCFLLSRNGPSDNAIIACQGAMREHGKLIVNIDDDCINKLIKNKVEGDDPNELLFEMVDDFLMKLPR